MFCSCTFFNNQVEKKGLVLNDCKETQIHNHLANHNERSLAEYLFTN